MSPERLCKDLEKIAAKIIEAHFAGFSITKCLGAGASAAVYEINNGSSRFALKVYDPKFFSGKNQRIEKQRIDLQLGLKDHGRQDLIKIFDAKEFAETAFVLMEHVPWDSLEKKIVNFPTGSIRRIIGQVASAARYLEERRMTHRDIKPANILVSPDFQSAKLLDLGVVRALDASDGPMTDIGGELAFVATAQYSSPEYLFRLGEHNEEFWRGLTFYQLGGVLHDLIVGTPLFEKQVKTNNKYVVAYSVLLEKPIVLAGTADPAIVRLARNCLHKDIAIRLKRVTWHEFIGGDENESDLRARLGLGAGKRKKVDRSGLEEIRIKLDDAAKALRHVLMPMMKREGYPLPQVDIEGTSLNERLIRVKFTPTDPDIANATIQATVSLRLEGGNKTLEIVISGSVSRPDKDEIVIQDKIDVWTCELNEASKEAKAIAIEIERKILKLYADAILAVDSDDQFRGGTGAD